MAVPDHPTDRVEMFLDAILTGDGSSLPEPDSRVEEYLNAIYLEGIGGGGAKEYAETSEAYAIGKRDGTDVPTTDPAYQNNSKYYADGAANSAEAAGNSATAAAGSAVDAAASAATAAADISLAEAFDPTKAYAKDEYVIYNGTLYKFKAAHPAGIWIGTDADEAYLADDVTQLKSAYVFTHLLDNTYPGLDLTEKFADEIAAAPYSGDEWAWIKARVTVGNFYGIHVRDYIPVTAKSNNFKARIIGINTYKGYGDTEVGNHIDWMFEELWPNRKPINPENYNNGLIPVEPVTTDGTTTEFVLTKEMDGIASVTQNGEGLTGWTYNASTFTLTFAEAPAAGTITVTGNGTEYPWLASDLYLWLNSLAGQVPNGTGLNPAVKHVDYTAGGVYYYLPAKLKAQIIEKRAYLPQRYSASGLLSDDNAGGWENIGKLWLPSECEVYGAPCWGGKGGHATMGNNIQYPYFAGNMNRVKKRSGTRGTWWVLSVTSGSTTGWCSIGNIGIAGTSNASFTYVSAPVCFRI